MEKVAGRFSDFSVSDIVDHSHKEEGWLENKDSKDLISYVYAFEMEPV